MNTYNRLLPALLQSVRVVLVSPRNPLNIGAAARAMANFGFADLAVVAPFEPNWRQAQSAIGAESLLRQAQCTQTLAEAVAGCTLILGTGSLNYRRAEQPVVRLPDLPALLAVEFGDGAAFSAARVALVFGPENHGLTREDLSWCHRLIEIPTGTEQPSMNLGQAVAVCLYEMATRVPAYRSADAEAETLPEQAAAPEQAAPPGRSASPTGRPTARPNDFGKAMSGDLDRLAGLIEETMVEVGYSPREMQPANQHDLRLMLRRLALSHRDTRRIHGLFRGIVLRLRQLPRR